MGRRRFYNKKWIFLYFALITWPANEIARAAEIVQNEISYYHDGKKIKFLLTADTKITISKNCLKDGQLSCMAYSTFLKKKEFAPSKNNLVGGTSPGSVRCKRFYGKVYIFLYSDKSEASFCVFEDGTAIDVASLN